MTAPQLRLQLIGQFQLADAVGGQVIIKGRRARALLAYVFLQQRQSELRGRLSGLFWSDRAEAQARASLRQCLTELRAALPADSRPFLSFGREVVALAPGAFRSDTSELIDALSHGRIRDAVDLLQQAEASPLLEGLELPGLFSQWLEQTREHFDRQLAQGVHRLLKTEEAAQMWPEVRELAEVYLRRDLVDEVVAATLMRAEAALGDASAARRRFQSLRTALDKAFGVEPGEGVQAALQAAAAPVDETGVARDLVARPERNPVTFSGPPLVVVATIESGHLEEDDRHLGAAITDEVIAGLSGFRDLKVTPAPSSLAELDKEAWARRGAAYFLGGVLRRNAEGVRLTTQLVRASDHHVIWSGRINTSARTVFDIIDQIGAQVVGGVSPTIDQDLERRVSDRSVGPYERYVSARSATHGAVTYEEACETAASLEAMIAEEPNFILPYLPLARIYNTDFCFTRASSSGPAEKDKAFALAKIALSKDRGHIYAYTVVGWCHLWRGEWAAARTHFDQAMALNPFHPDRVMEAGFGYLCLGDLDQAGVLLERCLVLNPTPKDSYYIDLAMLELVRGDYERATRRLELVASTTTWALLYRALSSTLGGRPDAGLNAAVRDRIAAVWPSDRPMTTDAMAQWVLSHHPFAKAETSAWLLASVRQILA